MEDPSNACEVEIEAVSGFSEKFEDLLNACVVALDCVVGLSSKMDTISSFTSRSLHFFPRSSLTHDGMVGNSSGKIMGIMSSKFSFSSSSIWTSKIEGGVSSFSIVLF